MASWMVGAESRAEGQETFSKNIEMVNVLFCLFAILKIFNFLFRAKATINNPQMNGPLLSANKTLLVDSEM